VKALRNNTLAGLMEWFYYHLDEMYGVEEARSITKMIISDFFGFTAVDLVLRKNDRFSESQILQLYRAIKQLKENVPVQHITGKSFFRNLILSVSPDVLIPRPETEELVAWIVDDIKSLQGEDKSNLKIWDIGTGSGAISISLAGEITNARVYATDISEKALNIAKLNAEANNVDVSFILHNILADSPFDEKFDVIVSNPPYIRDSEKRLMHANVLSHEPHLALFVPDDDPLMFYRSIAKTAMMTLKPGGSLYVEINEALGQETAELFTGLGLSSVTIKKDLFGKDRFARATK
jgi:release factor glutamine methyltransferase